MLDAFTFDRRIDRLPLKLHQWQVLDANGEHYAHFSNIATALHTCFLRVDNATLIDHESGRRWSLEVDATELRQIAAAYVTCRVEESRAA